MTSDHVPTSTFNLSILRVLFCFVLFCFVLFCFVLFCFVLVWFGLVWFGLVWFGLVWFGLGLFILLLLCFCCCCCLFVSLFGFALLGFALLCSARNFTLKMLNDNRTCVSTRVRDCKFEPNTANHLIFRVPASRQCA